LWLQSSFAGEFRKCPASIGGKYISGADVFTSPQPFPSWTLDSNNDWQAPTPKPDGDGFWYWDEATQQWVR
jgi:hypothetical protein